MSSVWIVLFNFSSRRSFEGSVLAIRVVEGNSEVIQAGQDSFATLAGRRRDNNGNGLPRSAGDLASEGYSLRKDGFQL